MPKSGGGAGRLLIQSLWFFSRNCTNVLLFGKDGSFPRRGSIAAGGHVLDLRPLIKAIFQISSYIYYKKISSILKTEYINCDYDFFPNNNALSPKILQNIALQ